MQKLKRAVYSDGFWAAIMLTPNFLVFLVFVLFPIVSTFVISFMDWDILRPPSWIGLQNYIRLYQDPIFWKVVGNTFYYTFVSVPIGIVLSFLLALLLDRTGKLIKIYRVIYFMPVISSMVVVAIVWAWLYNPEFGLINYLLSLFGIKGPAWLSDPHYAMPAIIITSVWKNLGYNMMLFLAGFQSIDGSYYEAAEIDGATFWQKTRYITIPLVSFTSFFVLITSIINSFQVFDQISLMTDGGPNRSTSVLVHYLYENAFKYFKMGYASTIAVILTIVVFIITMLEFRLIRYNDVA